MGKRTPGGGQLSGCRAAPVLAPIASGWKGRASRTISLLRWMALRMFTMLCALSVFAITWHDWLPLPKIAEPP